MVVDVVGDRVNARGFNAIFDDVVGSKFDPENDEDKVEDGTLKNESWDDCEKFVWNFVSSSDFFWIWLKNQKFFDGCFLRFVPL